MTADGARGDQVIVIGLRDVYEDVRSLNTQVTRMDAKLDSALLTDRLRIDHLGGEVLDHETRLRSLEARPVVTPRSVWVAVSAISAVVGVIIAIIVQLVKL